MSDDLDPVRRLRPDTVRPGDPPGPSVFSRHKEDLMAMIDDDTATTTRRVQDPAMYPRLAYLDETAALSYLTRVFGFVERREARMGAGTPDDAMLAWLDFGDGVVMICRANDSCHDVHQIYSPQEVGRATAMINVAVHDIDEHYRRAVAEGATITMPIEDAFYGWRRYEATDLEGHRWHFTESLDDIRARGGRVNEDE